MQDNRGNLLFRSTLPRILYFWMVTFLLLFGIIVLFLNGTISDIFTLCIIYGIAYYLFCRNSCTIEVYENKFKIHYFLWNGDAEVKFNEIVLMDYKKGFFDFRAPSKNTYHFKLICYDSLFLELASEKIQLDINTHLGGFNKLLEVINKKLFKNDLNDGALEVIQ